MKIPLRPPTMNMATKPAQFNITVLNRTWPPQIVPIQLKVLIAEGKAIIIVDVMKVMPSAGFIPLVNMWCPHTMNPSPAMADIE